MAQHRRESARHRGSRKTISALSVLVVAGAGVGSLVVSSRATPVSAARDVGSVDSIDSTESVGSVAVVTTDTRDTTSRWRKSLKIAPSPAESARGVSLLRQQNSRSAPRDLRVPLVGASGLTLRARNLYEYLAVAYPQIRVIGGVRPDPIPDHPSGLALDVMVDSNTQLGNEIYADIMSRKEEFGVRYALWQKPKHYDHIHFCVYR